MTASSSGAADRVAEFIHVQTQAPDSICAEAGIVVEERTDLPARQFGPQFVDRACKKIAPKDRLPYAAWRILS